MENYNGLVRQYIPKGTSFIDLTAERLKEIEEEINLRPRKILYIKSPSELKEQTGCLMIFERHRNYSLEVSVAGVSVLIPGTRYIWPGGLQCCIGSLFGSNSDIGILSDPSTECAPQARMKSEQRLQTKTERRKQTLSEFFLALNYWYNFHVYSLNMGA